MRQLILISTVVLLTAMASLADEFVDKLDFYYPRYHWAGAVKHVIDNPDKAQEFLARLSELVEAEKDNGRRKVLWFYGSFVERVLAVKVRGEESSVERPSTGLDLAQPIDEAPSSIVAADEIKRARQQLKFAAMALDLGAYHMAQRWLRNAVFASHKVAWADAEVPPDLVALQDRYRLYLMSSNTAGLVYPKSDDAVVASEIARGNREGELIGTMAFVQSARLSYDTKALDEHLEHLLEIADGDLLFVGQSYQFERRALQEFPSWSEFQHQFTKIWAKLPSSFGQTDDLYLASLKKRWIADAAQVWLEQLTFYEQDASEAEREKLSTEIFQTVEALGFYWPRVRRHLKEADMDRLAGSFDAAQANMDKAEKLYRLALKAQAAEEARFWEVAGQEKYVPVPSVTHLGALHALWVRGQAMLLLDKGSDLSPGDFQRLGELVEELRQLTRSIDVQIGREAVVARYAAELVERTGDASAYPNILNESKYTAIVQDEPVALAEVLTARGDLLRTLGQSAEAQKDYRKAVDSVEAYLVSSGASPHYAKRLRAQARPAYERLAELLLQAGENENAMSVLSRLAQIQTRQVMEKALVDSGPGEVHQLAQKAKTLQKAVQSLSDIERETSNSDSLTKKNDKLIVGTLLAETKSQFYATVKELQRSEPDFTKLSVRPLNFARIQQAIPADATVVQYFPAPDKLYIFVASREKLVVRTVPISRDKLYNEALGAISELSNFHAQAVAGGDWTNPAIQPLRESLLNLEQALIAPIRSDLEGRPVLAVIPSGLLNYVPFATLLVEGPNQKLHFLVQDYQIASVLKAVDLDSLLTPPANRTGALVGIGNPDGTLNAAELELEAIAKLFPKNTTLKGSAATKKAVQSLLTGTPSFVHLATHGQVNSEEPLESYLVVSDGRLSLSDITGLQLGEPSLVTLSACQTALGETNFEPGQDLTTLAEAFWFAGGRSMVASLWSVADDSTGDLMSYFYGDLKKGLSKAEALRNAQLALLENPTTSAPYHWAPFILIGDWR